jgi:hypothetical protein
MKIAITIIFGIILTFASFGLIGFATELTGLASNAKASDYFLRSLSALEFSAPHWFWGYTARCLDGSANANLIGFSFIL